MSDDGPLPGTAIEWYMLGVILVGVNVIGLLVSGHTLPQALSMGLFFGLAMATVALLAAVGWQVVSDRS